MQHDEYERDLASMRDMVQCIDTLYNHIIGLDKDTVEGVQELYDAVLYRFIVLGEAANRVSDELREKHPEIPWVSAIKMRNFLIHVYDEIKWEIVWDTILKDIPALDAALRKALELPPPPDRTKTWGDL